MVDFIKAGAAHRRLSIPALAMEFGTGVSGRAIRTALEKEDMGRRYVQSRFLLMLI